MNLERYTRQLALPEISVHDQTRLANTHIAIIGAGGLGAASLPYLAAAGIGHITIYDHDSVSRTNLHRQTLYKDAQQGQNKAKLAAEYLKELNPDIEIRHCEEAVRPTRQSMDCFAALAMTPNSLILDGSDNFETKTLLNKVSIEKGIPLISASVNQWAGQIGIFAGFAKDKPCYHCLFPDLPTDARNCNEAGILGTSAGITGIYQAHVTLCYLLGLEGFEPGRILSFDFKTLRMQTLNVQKDAACPYCKDANGTWKHQGQQNKMTEMISFKDLQAKDHIIVDVRTDMEIANDPIPEDVIHMEVSTVPSRHEELPKDKLLAFVCAGNVRSVQAAEYLEGLGYTNICVLDKFSI